MFDAYRDRLRADAVIDHDEQIYGAIEVLCANVARAARVAGRVPPPARRRVPGPHARAAADAAPARRARVRRVRRRRRRPGHLRLRGRGSRVPHRLRPLLSRRRALAARGQLPLPAGDRAAAAQPARVQPPPRRRRRSARPSPTTAIARSQPSDRRGRTARRGAALEQVQAWLDDGAAARRRSRCWPACVRCCCRCSCSAREAGIPANAPVGIEVLDRTGDTRRARVSAARLGGRRRRARRRAISRSRRAARADRSRREVLQRIVGRRRRWTLARLRALAELDATRPARRVRRRPRIARRARSQRGPTPRRLLRLVRDDIGLGGALETLDRCGRGPDASHRDDLNALLAVAPLAPDPAAFEPWLRARLDDRRIDADRDEVTLSTVHRVKGMEWPHVVVLGVARRAHAAPPRRRPRGGAPHLPRRDHPRRHVRAAARRSAERRRRSSTS